MKKVLTIILDGFGMREDSYGNAIKNAGMNNFINIWNRYPHCLLKANEEYVGLPDGQPSSSEFGHELIGAGRSVPNVLRETKEQLTYKNLSKNEIYQKLLLQLKNDKNKKLHIISMISDGGVSSHINYLLTIIDILKKDQITNNIYLELISDGIDSPRKSISEYITQLQPHLAENIKISSLCGRYYSLDEFNNYNITKLYYNLLFKGEGITTSKINLIINTCYQNKITDAYIPPIKTSDYSEISKEDVILLCDFGREPQKQIFEAIADPLFDKFAITNLNNSVYSLYEIDKTINKNYFFTTEPIKHTMSEYLAELGITQAKICESSKKQCLTYYYDGLRNKEFKNCDVYVVKTPKVKRMDEKPEMNSLTVAKTIIKCMEKDYDFILANFANADVLTKTGNYHATINSLQALDVCLGKIIEKAEENFYKIIIVGSHATADTVINRKNEIVTKNTLSSVPFIIMDKKIKLRNGIIKSVAPTILNYMDIAIPKEMKETELLFDKE